LHGFRPRRRGRRREPRRSPPRAQGLARLLVDTGSECTWIAAATLESIGVHPRETDRFQLANGSIVRRAIGFAIVHVGRRFTTDEVVFAEPGDAELLGARSLDGLGLVPDPRRKRLVSAGPIPAALAAGAAA
jgi:predicted aspartyl protease